MANTIYEDIACRTGGDIYVGVVGPVRSGKSTFIKRFMEQLVIPNIQNEAWKERATDELPHSAAGRTIKTTEPKFIPEDAVELTLGDNARMRIRMIDCVGYIIPSALGYIENEQPRMVHTPWFDQEVPFNMAAEVGTRKVIAEHSTIGLVVTTDGSITDLPRAEYAECEERVITELQELGKPFAVLLNCMDPHTAEAKAMAKQLSEKYSAPAGKENWRQSTIESILTNEKYKGSALLQKKFTTDFLTKKTKINEGEVPQYYIEESHEPIISPEDFEEVQAEFTRRKKLGRKYSGSTMFSAKLVCGDCGHFFGSKVWHSTSKYRRVIWQCNNKFKGEHFCSTPHLYEDEIKIRFISAFAAFFQNREMVLETCRMLLEDLSDTSALDTKIEMLTMELNDIGTLIREHIQKNAESVQNQDSYNLRYDELTEQYERKKGLLQKMQQKRIEHQSRIESMASFLRTLEKTNEPIDYFDDSIWRTTIEKVTVFHDGRMVFQFVDGTEIEA